MEAEIKYVARVRPADPFGHSHRRRVAAVFGHSHRMQVAAGQPVGHIASRTAAEQNLKHQP